MEENIKKLPDGIYNQAKLERMGLEETCPYCHSQKVELVIHGTMRQYKCQTCNGFFSPSRD